MFFLTTRDFGKGENWKHGQMLLNLNRLDIQFKFTAYLGASTRFHRGGIYWELKPYQFFLMGD